MKLPYKPIEELPYNPEDRESIVEFGKLLRRKTLREACGSNIENHGYSGKGNYGQVLEKYYFLYEPNSDSEPDFPIAELELKSSPLKLLKKNEYRSKERLVLNLINYLEVVNQTFETSSFYKKNANILLVFYLHQVGFNILDFLIKLVDVWSFPETDLEIIRKDWAFIKKKIADGKAHELSEGDTFYLGACTKGASSKTVRIQPFSKIPAKQRAYSLKQGYVNHIIASIANNTTEIYGKLIPSVEVAKELTIDQIVTAKFERYYGKTIKQILALTGVELNPNAKNFYASLTKVILGIELEKEIEEFEKAGIKVKTVKAEANMSIKESISFPAFDYTDIYNESWISSDLKDIIESKFLFIFFKSDGTDCFLEKVKFWNMPVSDRAEMRKVWLKTKKSIQTGNIVHSTTKNSKGQAIRSTNFPKKSENKVGHVRPHGSNALDTFPLPVSDILTKANAYSKHSFWFNNTYIRDEVYLK